jgi:hypothetical protein
MPSSTDPVFLAKIHEFWRAVVDGQPSEALGAFFPVTAYIQVKNESYPADDWRYRLLAHYDQAIETLHAQVVSEPRPVVFTGVTVPSAAEWILPGVEFNKGSYWRVLYSTVDYTAGGVAHTLPIISMISWRGEWYLIHILSFT